METGSELFSSLRPEGEGVSTLGEGVSMMAALRNQALHVTERFEDKETRMFLVSFSQLGSLPYRKKTQHSSVER